MGSCGQGLGVNEFVSAPTPLASLSASLQSSGGSLSAQGRLTLGIPFLLVLEVPHWCVHLQTQVPKWGRPYSHSTHLPNTPKRLALMGNSICSVHTFFFFFGESNLFSCN